MEDKISCSFCNKDKDEVKLLVANSHEPPIIYICNECIGVCCEIMFEKMKEMEFIEGKEG